MEISIVIPVYNRANIVPRTLKSVAMQTHRPIQVILVDNGSTDNTFGVLEEFKNSHETDDFKVLLLKEPKAGATCARNTGARAATGEWLMFFDSDDEMDTNLLDAYSRKIKEQNGGVDMVASRADSENFAGVKHEMPYYEKNLIVNHLFHSCLNTVRYIMRKSFYDRIGGWNEELNCWDDWEFGMRALLNRPLISFLNDIVPVHVHQSAESITGTDFWSKCGKWELSIDAVEEDIKQADVGNKTTLLKYIEFRRVVLAGLYAYEGKRELSKKLFDDTYSRLRHVSVVNWLYPLLYKYVGIGGLGATRIVKAIVR